jgi:hypothetical protein
MACLWTRMLTPIGSTSCYCIFLMLICDAIVLAFPLFRGFVCDSLQGLYPNGIFLGTLVVLKLWTIIFSSNQTCLDHARVISYSPQKEFSNDVLHFPISNLFTFVLRGFVVGSQIPNLIPNLSFDHNSCFSYLDEQ